MTQGSSTTTSLMLAAILLAGSSSFLSAQDPPHLVKNINPSGDSAPSELVTMGGFTYFVADDGVSGFELWKSDGTATGTVRVKDICSGGCSSAPYQLTVATVPEGERLFFSANTPTYGYELWKSDGTATGTKLVKNIAAGSTSSLAYEFTPLGNEIFFRASDASGVELWKSDGTSGGTVLVKDIAPGGAHSYPGYFTEMGGMLYFSALGSLGSELWVTDGTAGGTLMVRDIGPGPQSSNPSRLVAVGNTLFFRAFDGYGSELWKSDGTEGGTTIVRDIYPGYVGSVPDHLTEVGGKVFFVANQASTGRELWKSDGTYAGTVRVKDANQGSGSSDPEEFEVIDNVLFFSADDGLVGRELWRSDGTAAGTYLVKDINPFNQSQSPASSPSQLRSSNGVLFFAADGGVAGRELWTSDGTQGGTTRVADVFPGPSDSDPTEPTPASPSVLLFAADDGSDGRELWVLEGGAPELTLTKTFTESAVEAGTANHTFELEVGNIGSAPATEVWVTDSVDSRLAVTAISPASGCAGVGQFVDCTFPTLAPGAQETITVTYSVGSGVTPDTIVNVAQAGEFGGSLVEASDTVDIVPPCEGEPHIDIFDEEIYSIYVAEACVSISAGPTVNVMRGAHATLSAGDIVVLNDGFVVEDGATLVVGAN